MKLAPLKQYHPGLDYDRSPNDGISHACRNNKLGVNHIREREKPGIKLDWFRAKTDESKVMWL